MEINFTFQNNCGLFIFQVYDYWKKFQRQSQRVEFLFSIVGVWNNFHSWTSIIQIKIVRKFQVSRELWFFYFPLLGYEVISIDGLSKSKLK